MSMMRYAGIRKAGVLAAALYFTAGVGLLTATEVRAPVFAGRFYPATAFDLKRTLAELAADAEKSDPAGTAGLNLRALILPHAGYRYSGITAAHCVRCLAGRHFAKIIVMGPDHRVGIRTAAISAVAAYETPLGKIGLHNDCRYLRRKHSHLFEYNPLSDRTEHSVEVVLPFLQYSLGDFQLVPMVIGGADPQAVASAVAGVMDGKTLLVASSDLSHFLPYRKAVTWDRETLDLIKNIEPEKLMARQNSACGKAPVAVILHLARQRHWRPVLLDYRNSGDTAGDKSRVVGYAAVAFYETIQARGKGENPMENCYSKENGGVLLRLARRTITEKLGQAFDAEASARLEEKLREECFDSRSGTFVTLTLNGQLRGCIGNMSATVSLRDGVRQNAISAAFHDPRFSPLTDAELEKVRIEISILTEPQTLAYDGGDDLIGKLRPDIDGVIISKGLNRATFLPQVWKQLPQPSDFLSHLCMKAGLESHVWQTGTLDVQTYQVVSFEEEN
jgi:MEMO1 family protein